MAIILELPALHPMCSVIPGMIVVFLWIQRRIQLRMMQAPVNERKKVRNELVFFRFVETFHVYRHGLHIDFVGLTIILMIGNCRMLQCLK